MASRKSHQGCGNSIFVWLFTILIQLLLCGSASRLQASEPELRFIQVEARSKEQRSIIADLGVSIEALRSDSVWGFANRNAIGKLRKAGIRILGEYDYRTARGGHDAIEELTSSGEGAHYHNYQQDFEALKELQAGNTDISRLVSIGKSVENRDLWALHINSSPDALASGTSAKPGAVYMGNHHAREHLSTEVPLMFAQYLLNNRQDSKIGALLDSRDIWIIPMVNPDGSEWDISDAGEVKWWRKNRRQNNDGTFGVDLNRNYGFHWGTGGSDADPASDIYMGPSAFSEPETAAIKSFVDNHMNLRTLLTFHTFSELVLYPWGYTYEPVSSARDHAVFRKMAETMAQWNHYTPEQTSSLYIATGDTTDWAYGTHGVFAFTFELSPKNMSQGGFYPGTEAIERVFQDNLKPCLYLLDVTGDPYQVLGDSPSGWLRNYVEPKVPTRWETDPLAWED